MSNLAMSHLKLLVRHRPLETEGVAEYLQHLALANGYRAVSEICQILNTSLIDIVASGQGKLQDVIHGRTHPISLRHFSGNHAGTLPYHNGSGVMGNARVCITCLNESDRLSNHWSEPLSVSCKKHAERLLDHCPACQRPIRRMDSQYRCRCGAYFADQQPMPTPAWEDRFFGLFAPWKKGPVNFGSTGAFINLEHNAASLLRRIIKRSGHFSAKAENTNGKSWLFSSDDAFIDSICQDRLHLASIVEKKFAQATSFKNEWEQCQTAIQLPPPEIINLIDDAHDWKSWTIPTPYGRHEKQVVTDGAKIIRQLVQEIGCSRVTAEQLLQDNTWSAALRAMASTQGSHGIEADLRNVFTDSVSVEALADSIGIPANWRGHFARRASDCLRVWPAMFRTWRIPKQHADKLVQNFKQCADLALPNALYPDGYIPIADISNGALSLQTWIQKHLESGTLQLTFERRFPLMKLTDFSIPARALAKFKFPWPMQQSIARSTRYPYPTNGLHFHEPEHAVLA